MSTTKKFNAAKPILNIFGENFKLPNGSFQLIGHFLAETLGNSPSEEPNFNVSIGRKLATCDKELELSDLEISQIETTISKVKSNMPSIYYSQSQDFLKGV